MPYRTTPAAAARKAAVRARILEAARRLFTERGYAATSVQDVVAAAGTSVGNCYFYFPDKAALLLALAEQASAEVGEHADAALAAAGDDGDARLAAAVAAGVAALLERRELARVLVIEAGHPEVRAAMLAHFIERTARVFDSTPWLAAREDRALLAHAWQGAIATAVEGVVRGAVPGEPRAVALALARWNLQAIGLPPERVERALAMAEGAAGA